MGGDVLELPTDIFDNGDRKGTIIDSGTTLAYVPEAVYEPLMTKVNLVSFNSHSFQLCFYTIL